MAEYPVEKEPNFHETMRMLENTDLASAGLFNGMYKKVLENDCFLKQQLDSKAGKAVAKPVTLEAAGWTGEEAPYSYTVPLEEATETNNIEVLPPATPSQEVYEQLSSAGLCGGTQTAGSITLLAYGDRPTIDLPVIIIVRGD